jgi:uncharacterized membrane protein YphA (DoxX/SURF4 family)/peroxiredoxin
VSFAVSLSQLFLCVVFAVSGVAKLTDRTGTRRAIEAFGVPARLAPAGATLLPIVELAVVAALVAAVTGRLGALAAALLLVAFCVAIGRTLRAGSAPDCNCFGGLTQTEVGRGTLIRNLVLAGVAAFIVLSGQSVSAFGWITVPAARDRSGIVFMVACLAGLGWFCWRLLQQNGRLLLRLDAAGVRTSQPPAGARTLSPLEPGTAAPRFSGRDLSGEPVSLESLLAPGLPVALVFTDPGCGACGSALTAVARAQRERAHELTLAVLSSGSINRIEDKATEFGLVRVVPQDDETLFDAYRVNGVPGVVRIDRSGFLSDHPVLGADEVREVLLGSAPAHEAVRLAAR